MLEKLERPQGIVDAVLDTDTYNEVDDQFALAYMFCSQDKYNIKAIYAAPFVNDAEHNAANGMEMSFNEIQKVLKLMGISNFNKVYRGSKEFLKDEITPVISDAAQHLATLAMNYSSEKPLYVIAIATLTNIASAILINPQIANRMVVVWLGGKARIMSDASEFNLNKDVAAARVVFNNMKDALIQVPCEGCVSAFTTTEYELKHFLYGKNELCDYLVDNVIKFHANKQGKLWSKPIWDVCAVAWLLNDNQRFMDDCIEKNPIITYDKHYVYTVGRGFIRYVYNIKRDNLYEDLFSKLSDESNFKYIER